MASASSATFASASAEAMSASRPQRDARSFEPEVGAHAARGEVPDALLPLGPQRLRVEVARPVVAGVLEQLDEEERVLQADRAEAEVLVIAPDALGVEVDVEQLAGPERLRDPVEERQTGHRLVRDLRIDADHLRVLEALDEREHVADRRQEDVAARLVGLRLEREAHVVAAVAHVAAEEVDRLAVALERVAGRLGGVGLDALAPAPEHVDGGAQLGTDVDRPHHLLQRVAAHLTVVGGEGAVLEDRVREQVGGGHRDLHPGLVEGCLNSCLMRSRSESLASGGSRSSSWKQTP